MRVPVLLLFSLVGCSSGEVAVEGPFIAVPYSALPPPTEQLATVEDPVGIDTPAMFGEVAPDTLIVFLGHAPTTCAEPYAYLDCSERQWSLLLGIPRELQKPGELVLDAFGPDTVTPHAYGRAGGPHSDGDCWWVLGGVPDPSVQIESIDDGGLAIVLDEGGGPHFEAQGRYEVTRCP